AFAAALEETFDAESRVAFFNESFSEAVFETDFLEVEEETSACLSSLSLGVSDAPMIRDKTETAKRINGILPVILLSRFFTRLIPQMIKVTQKAIPVVSQSIMKNVIPILLKQLLTWFRFARICMLPQRVAFYIALSLHRTFTLFIVGNNCVLNSFLNFKDNCFISSKKSDCIFILNGVKYTTFAILRTRVVDL